MVAVTGAYTVVSIACVYTERMCGCNVNGIAVIEDRECVVMVSVGHDYVGGTRDLQYARDECGAWD